MFPLIQRRITLLIKAFSVHFLLLILLLCFKGQAYAHVEPTYFLMGNIGSEKVGVRIDQFVEVSYLKFFTMDHLYDISFQGTNDSTSFYFERKESDGSVSMIYIRHWPDETWKGHLVKKGDTLDIVLSPIRRDLIDHAFGLADQFLEDLDEYAYLRTSVMKLDTVEIVKGHEYDVCWLSEPLSGVRFFRLKGNMNQDVSVLNQRLTAQHLSMIEQFFQCGEELNRGEINIDSRIEYLNNDVLSYSILINTTCFSRQVNELQDYYTVKISTVQMLRMEDVFFVGDGDLPSSHSVQWFKYRRETLASFLISQLQELYPSEFESVDCDYSEPRAWQMPQWFLTNQGVSLRAHFPGAVNNCDNTDWAIIPYEKLKDQLRLPLEQGL